MLTERALRRRLNAELALTLLPWPVWGAAGAFAAGRVVSAAVSVWALGLGVVGGVVWVVWQVRRRGWSEDQAAVMLDRLAGAGGLLLTLREVPARAWEPSLDARLATARAPSMKVGRPLLVALAGVAFAVAASFVPARAVPKPAVQAAAESRVDSLVLDREALAAEQQVPAAIDAELARLHEELAASRFDATDWEAADAVRESMERAASEQAGRLDDAARAAEALAQALDQGSQAEGAAREREELERALTELGDGEQGGSGQKPGEQGQQGQQKQGQGQQGQQGEGEQGQQAQRQNAQEGQGSGSEGDRSGPKDSKSARELRDALDRRREQLAKRFGEGQGQGNGRQQARSGQRPGQGPGGNGRGGEPGQGPGHGDAPDTPLRFGEESKFQKDRLAYEALPKGRGGEDSGRLWGMQGVAPKATPDAPIVDPVGGVAGADDTPGLREGLAPPRHRATVRRYFDAKQE